MPEKKKQNVFYTKKGDEGTTKFFNTEKGKRDSKNSCRTEALGSLDELNSFLGLCRVKALELQGDVRVHGMSFSDILLEAQEQLFIVQAEVAGADKELSKEKVVHMEEMIDFIGNEIPQIKGFSIAGGTELSSLFDFARTITRRTERHIVAAVESHECDISQGAKSYVNRLSSLLFALARFSNHKEGVEEKNPSYK